MSQNVKFCEKLSIPFIDLDNGKDYDQKKWFALAKGMEGDAERGNRCTMCFDMRMMRTAAYAKENGFDVIATTNATSRWKDTEQVDGTAQAAADRFGLEYWRGAWKSDRLTLLKYQISAGERFYKQEYCGCSYSLRDSNLWREKEGIGKIKIGGEEAGLGSRWFTDAEVDAEEENQDVVDSFFADANAVADKVEEGNNRRDAWKVLKGDELKNLYEERKKGDHGGKGLNNW